MTSTKTIHPRNPSYSPDYDQLAIKLNNPKNSSMTYWFILKTFYNGKKISTIPPLFATYCLISNFKRKANLFNYFFASQCTSLENSSIIPNSQAYVTYTVVDFVKFNDHIIKAIRNLDTNKEHGHDNITI